MGTGLALVTTICVISRSAMVALEGNWTIQEELPLHLCRLMAFIFPWVIYTQNRKWFGVTYFWTMGGTIQALLTPDLVDGFPHREYLIYFIFHGVLVYLPIYCLMCFKWRITWEDFKRSFIYLNVLAFFIFILNQLIGSNYLYIGQKPPGPSLMDALGPWPWYILSLEGVVLVLFGVFYIPWMIVNRKKHKES